MMADGAKGSRDHDARYAVLLRRFEYVAGAQYVGVEQLAAVTRVALDRRDHRSAVVHALASPHGDIYGFRVTEIALHAFHVELFDTPVVVIRMDQHTDAFAVRQQPIDQVETQMP
jgi:hypothetical protein